jgi:hypothetical protein
MREVAVGVTFFTMMDKRDQGYFRAGGNWQGEQFR